MSRLRLVPCRKLAAVAEAAGFKWVRCSGSHNTFRFADGRVLVIPDHGNQVIVWPLLRRITRDMGLTVDAYSRLVGQSRRPLKKSPMMYGRICRYNHFTIRYSLVQSETDEEPIHAWTS